MLDCLRPFDDLETEFLDNDDFLVTLSRGTKDFLRPMFPIEFRARLFFDFALTRLSATGPKVCLVLLLLLIARRCFEERWSLLRPHK